MERGIVRLLTAATRHGNDPELFAGLVHTCRYAGLYDESIAAHAEARRLDPTIATGIDQTLMMTGDIERMIGTAPAAVIEGGDDGIRVIGLGLHGYRDQAVAALARMQARPMVPLLKSWTGHLAAWLEGRVPEMIAAIATLSS